MVSPFAVTYCNTQSVTTRERETERHHLCSTLTPVSPAGAAATLPWSSERGLQES